MKKEACFSLLAFLLFCSFVTNTQKGEMVHPGTTLPKDVSWKIEGDYKVYMFYWFTCSGDQIVIPELTIHYDTHGVNNGKMSLFQGKINYTGLGFSELTFEYYYLNDTVLMIYESLNIIPRQALQNGEKISKDFHSGKADFS